MQLTFLVTLQMIVLLIFKSDLDHQNFQKYEIQTDAANVSPNPIYPFFIMF